MRGDRIQHEQRPVTAAKLENVIVHLERAQVCLEEAVLFTYHKSGLTARECDRWIKLMACLRRLLGDLRERVGRGVNERLPPKGRLR